MTAESVVTARIARQLVCATRILLAERERVWADALLSELGAIEPGGERLRVALSGSRGLLAIGVERQLRTWLAHFPALMLAIALGLLTAAIDVSSDSRWPLRIALLVGCVTIALRSPQVSRIGGFLIGLGVPLLTTITGIRGPYEVDRGDAWWPVIPAFLLTSCIAALRSRFTRRAS
jgi:hypothetical protein